MAQNQGFDVGGLFGQLLGGNKPGAAGQVGGGQAGGGLAGGVVGKVLPMLMGMLGGGGLSKIMGQLTSGGLGKQAQSWLDPNAANQPVSAGQLTKALGPSAFSSLGTRAGVSSDQAAQVMAGALPTIVSTVAPTGKIPENLQVPDVATMQAQVNHLVGGATEIGNTVKPQAAGQQPVPPPKTEYQPASAQTRPLHATTATPRRNGRLWGALAGLAVLALGIWGIVTWAQDDDKNTSATSAPVPVVTTPVVPTPAVSTSAPIALTDWVATTQPKMNTLRADADKVRADLVAGNTAAESADIATLKTALANAQALPAVPDPQASGDLADGYYNYDGGARDATTVMTSNNANAMTQAVAELKQGSVRVDQVNARIQALTH